MASIRKRGSSYLIVVSMGYDYNGKRSEERRVGKECFGLWW